MTLTPQDQLRLYLGEVVGPGQTETDTLFSDEQVQQFLDDADGSVVRAAREGWRAKAAELASLVDVTEGNSSRAMSQAHAQALDMVDHFNRLTSAPTDGRTRVGRIRRRWGASW